MLRIMVLLLTFATSFNVVADEAIGRIILSLGDNHAENLRGETRTLKRDSAVFEKERIWTSERGRLHVRFNDGSMINLKPNSKLQLSRYRYREEQPEEGVAVFQLMRGGLRTISGKIGKANPDSYRFQTVLATIGIRGTEYEIYLCDRRCAEKNTVIQGVAGGVDKGGIVIDTSVGGADLNPGKYFEMERGATAFRLSDERPAMLKIGDPEPEPEPEPKPEPVAIECEESSDGGQGQDPFQIWSSCTPRA